ncbi:MAG: restriction endonuclease subunit S [Oscillospiraceae bacterium]|nr:restriction endonuclease subunit S [Oscillospiraceae bacterium]
MSKLNELIKELCPDGVEYIKIKDYFKRLKGTPITAEKMKEIAKDDGKIKIFAGGKTVINANEEDIPKANITKIPSVLVQSRGVIDVIYYEKPFTFKNEMWAYTHENQITVKYLYYVMKKNILYFRDCASGMGSLPQISLKVTENFKIPLPPLEVQHEIVRILDSFTKYTALLEKELTLRKKQYTYYRDYLLNFGDDVKRWTLGEIATFIYGFTDKAKDNGQVRYLRITDISDDGYLLNNEKKYINITEENKKYLVNAGDILVARTGASYGKTLYFSDKEQSIFASFLIKISLDNNIILNKYYWHFSKSDLYWSQAKKLVSKGGQPQFNSGAISKIKIPVPSLEEQERIVKILDRFDMLCNDLTNGLPAEIQARQKQYAYYRDKLLNFKKLK